ncbi:HAMP domain-containing sensor histidine kinase [Fulvivirgaceae bacterium BMA10]|uniref:histidine kinase n=1 Tax=Splendidivirga corallicola TaxID=3051826 RepID=A0ABT8KTI2_9BACT|nr:HAMP domain-containing sensor histidine kinase [Fulvivirgaceae bacterium BMA10]
MSRNTIRLVIILATVSLVGITVIQIFWVRKAFDLREKQFNQRVNIALKTVVDDINRCNNYPPSTINPIKQLSSNYYTVMVNNFIDPLQLEEFLTLEFKKKEIVSDFEYGIYDCSNEKMVYGNYVNLDSRTRNKTKAPSFPKLDRENYYFGVYFPTKDGNLISKMGIWSFSSAMLLIVIVFFGYALFVILKQKRLSEIQKDFINNMTHEFKTPISTITISSEVLKNPDIINNPRRLLNYATIIQEESQRLKKQVDRVLQMASIEKQEINLKKEKVDVHEIINQAIQNIQASLDEKKGKIACDLKATASIVSADKLHLTNIIYNLLDNALKYCKQVPSIKIFTESIKNGIRISLRDNGIGISSENQKKIFNKFYRVPTGNVHDVKGFGLGLNYVKVMVRAHRGEVSLVSSLDVGSTFSIYLPFD